MKTVKERIASLRILMQKHGIAAYLVQSTDEHQNEYTPENKKRRQWMSGFTGSQGDLMVFSERAFLWTDSRYFLQAESELRGTGIELLKAGVIEYADIYDWIKGFLKSGDALGIDPALTTLEDFANAEKRLSEKRIIIKAIKTNLVDSIWSDNTEPHPHPAEIHPIRFCGESHESKIARVRDRISEAGCHAHIVSSPDSVCWLFNIRGKDVPYNPVLISHALITESEAYLFLDPKKVTAELEKHLDGSVKILQYSEFESFCRNLAEKKPKLWIDPKRTNHSIASIFEGSCELSLAESPVYYYKALKNDTEIASLAESMIKDGVAMVRFLSWLAKNAETKLTEDSASKKLEAFRMENEGYAGPSFHTISAYGEHGAIVHYSHTEESNIPIAGNGLFLLDSGGHYPGGTTDITRTVAVGTPTREQIERYTCVLKGHIALASARFPKGTKGIQLDTLARKPLWDEGLDYGHGTGHGVGFYLNVHEGPQSISSSKLASPGLEPGMLVSDEPGFYKKGEYGIRIENILLVTSRGFNPNSEVPFYEFRTMTLCPYETKLIDRSMLTIEEALFVELYHKKIRETITPLLKDEADKAWLESATAPLPGNRHKIS